MSDVTNNQFNMSNIRIPKRYPHINVSYVLSNVNQNAFNNSFDYNNDILTYLEFESSRYFGNTFPNATLEDLSTLYEAKVKLLEQISLQFNHTQNHWEQNETIGSARHANALSENSASFVPFDKQSGSSGQVSIGGFGYLANLNSCPGWVDGQVCGGGAGWCAGGLVHAVNINYPTKASLVCLTDWAISFAVSGDKGAFTQSYWSYLRLQISGQWAASTSTSPLNYLGTASSYKTTSLFGDFDGNGLEDNMIVSKPNGFTIYTTYVAGGVSATDWGMGSAFNIVNVSTWPNPFCKEVSSQSWFDIRGEGIRIGDFNGDGKDDLVCFSTANGTLSFLQSTNGVLNQWTQPSTSFTGVTWCKTGNIHIGDFNGDGKSDLMCFLNKEIYMMFSDGNWNFYSPVGNYNGFISLAGKLQLPSSTKAVFLTVGDFDGDGYSDILFRGFAAAIDNIVTYSYVGNYMLFGSKDQILQSGTGDQNGSVDIGGISWGISSMSTSQSGSSYTKYPNSFPPIDGDVILAGDFDGDGKDDLVDHNYNGNNFLMLSRSLPINTVPEYQISMSVSNFNIAPTTINLSLAKAVNKSVVCDNRVRPDETLTCKISNTAASVDITRSITANGWKNLTKILQDEIDNLYVSPVMPTYSQSSTSIPVSFYTSKNHNSVSTPNTVTSSAETLVKSGDCVKIITTTKYVNDVTATYTAKGSVSIVDDNGLPFSGVALLNIAKTAIPYPMTLASDNQFEAVFNIAGQVIMDLAIDANSTTINC